jgi:hypothetical protein
MKSKQLDVVRGSGNIFRDLGNCMNGCHPERSRGTSRLFPITNYGCPILLLAPFEEKAWDSTAPNLNSH